MDTGQWMNFPDKKPKKRKGSYLVQTWDGHITVGNWVAGRWSLYRPAAILRFTEYPKPPEVTPEEKWERGEILSEAEDTERKIMGTR